MFCNECGSKLKEGAAFCTKCGTPVDKGADSKENATNHAVLGENSEFKKTSVSEGRSSSTQKNIMKMLTNKNKKTIGIITAAILVIIIAIVIIVSQPKKIDLEEMVEIEYSGYDGYASAYVTFDEGNLYDLINEENGNLDVNSSTLNSDEYNEAIHYYNNLHNVISSIQFEVVKDENLSNGDEIKVEITYDNSLAKELKIKFTGSSITQTVEGLEPVTKVDPFKDLTVGFSGIAPYGTIELEYNDDNPYGMHGYHFDVDKREGLKNGDLVNVSVTLDDKDTLVNGYIFTVKEQEYKVEGLEGYVENYADLSGEFLDKMKAEAEDIIYAYTASSYDSRVSLADLKYSGYIFSTAKEDAYYGNNYNNIYIIYSGMVSHSEEDFTSTTVHFPVKFTDILKSGDNLSYADVDGISGSSNLRSYRYSTRGYTNPLTCYMELVESNRDTYVSEAGDGFEKYAEQKNISQISDISETFRNELAADAKDLIESYIAGYYHESSHIDSLELKGEYLLVSKNQGTDYANNNKYIVVYSGTASNDEEKFETTEVYFPVEYDGIISLPDEEYMVTTRQGIIGTAYFEDSSYSTDGYIDGADMFNDIVTANRDLYTYEVSEGLKEFGE